MKIQTGTSIANAKNEAQAPSKAAPEVPMVYMSRNNPRIVGDYNEIDMMEAESAKQAKVEMWIAKAIGTKLVEHYPNRQWGVQVDTDTGIIIITCPSLSTEKGYHIHMKNKTLFDLTEQSVMAAGEILERFNLTRAKNFDPEKLETLARDAQDQVISPDA